MLRRAVEAFARHPRVDGVRVVIGAEDAALRAAVSGLDLLLQPVIGGATRQETVRRRPGRPRRARASARAGPRRRAAAGLGGGDRAGARRPWTTTRPCPCCRSSTRSSGWTTRPCWARSIARRPRQGADAAGVPLRGDPGGASPAGGRATPTTRRSPPPPARGRLGPGEESNLKLTLPEDLSVAERLLGAHALAHRARVRRPRLRPGPAAGPVRGDGPARAGARRPLRRRRRLPRRHRRDPGHDRGRRHRQPFPAQRPAMARRRSRPGSCAMRRPAGRAAAGGSRTSIW